MGLNKSICEVGALHTDVGAVLGDCGIEAGALRGFFGA